VADAIGAMLKHWEHFAARGGEFDLGAKTSRLALDVIGRTLLGADVRDEGGGLGRAMVEAFEYSNHHTLNSIAS